MERHRLTKCDMIKDLPEGAHDTKMVENNTIQYRDKDGNLVLRHFQTDIITSYSDGAMMFKTDGWNTLTTRSRLNRYQSVVKFYTKRGVLHASDGVTTVVFAEGLHWHPDTGFDGEGKIPDKSLLQKIKAYAKEFANTLPVDQPSGGDCWYCMFEREGHNCGVDHLLSHISDEERYFVPSLLVRAMREKGVGDVVLASCFKQPDEKSRTTQSFYLDIARRYAQKAVRDYLFSRLVLGRVSEKRPATGFSCGR